MTEINWPLIESLKGKSHPNLPIRDGEVIPELPTGVLEVIGEARVAQHLLDLIGIPTGEGYGRDTDARVCLAVHLVIDLRERLSRISSWHSRETGPGGLVGDYCVTCHEKWPCETRRMADDGTEKEDSS